MSFDSKALDRVLEAVDHRFIPPGLNRDGLRDDVSWAGAQYALRKDIEASTKRQRKQGQIVKAAKRLKILLCHDDDWRRAYPPTGIDPVKILRDVIKATEARLSPPPEPDNLKDERNNAARLWLEALGMEERSAFEWLAGQHLPEVFEAHFGRKATIARDAIGTLTSPYISFACQVLKELGIAHGSRPYSREAIAKALSDVRGRRSRRRRRNN